MSRPAAPPPVCDGPGCGKQKQESNHWWQVGAMTGGQRVEFMVAPIDIPRPNDPAYSSVQWFDFCGQTCLFKWLSEQMGRITG